MVASRGLGLGVFGLGGGDGGLSNRVEWPRCDECGAAVTYNEA
jgi:hypothetical protein